MPRQQLIWTRTWGEVALPLQSQGSIPPAQEKDTSPPRPGRPLPSSCLKPSDRRANLPQGLGRALLSLSRCTFRIESKTQKDPHAEK